MKPLQPHHVAWLLNHKERDEKWLRERLLDGFDVHHLDGNHSNNDPLNLVLIEAHDHMRMHGADAMRRGVMGIQRRKEIRPQAEMAYHAYARSLPGMTTWEAVALEVNWSARPNALLAVVREAALENGWKWPIYSQSEISKGRHQRLASERTAQYADQQSA